MTCHVRLMREGVLSRVSGRTWQRDVELGANTLTIACGHTIDALCSVVGEFADVAAVVSTQATTWHETDTGLDLPVTSPDNVLVSGNLQSGGVGVGADWQHRLGWKRIPYGNLRRRGDAGGGSRWIRLSLQQVSVRGARGGSNDLQELTPPAGLHPAPEIPAGSAYNVGQLYSQFAASIQGDESADPSVPDFDHAVGLHRLIDAIRAVQRRRTAGCGGVTLERESCTIGVGKTVPIQLRNYLKTTVGNERQVNRTTSPSPIDGGRLGWG